jgi:hypothetical protein
MENSCLGYICGGIFSLLVAWVFWTVMTRGIKDGRHEEDTLEEGG